MPEGLNSIQGFVILMAIAAVAVTYLPAIMIKHFQRQALRRASRGKLALTYDDGPDPLLTPRLLDLLRKYDAKASFFLLGFRAMRSPEICDLLARSGHELGCHAQWHLNCWMTTPWRAARNIEDGYPRMEQWMPDNAPFRPPYGKLTTWTWWALRRRGRALRWWTCDGCDTHPVLPDPSAVADRIIASGGGVVLMHGHDRGPERHQYVLQLTELLLIAARRQGIEICSMNELCCA